MLPVSAVSRKQHGAAGNFDIDLPHNGPIGIECRTGGTAMDFELVMTFAGPVTFDSAVVTSGSGSVATAVPSGNQVTISLTGVANAQLLTVGLFDTNDGLNIGDVGVRVGMVLGDTTENGEVNASDIGQAKAQSGQPVTGANFRMDVTANGSINSSDIGLVKAQSGIDLRPGSPLPVADNQ